MRVLLGSLVTAAIALTSVNASEKFACNASALTTDERAHYVDISKSLFAGVQEKRELKDGYAFRLGPAMLVNVAEWVSFERKCCPFFTFNIEQSRDQGPLWLRVTGPEGVKAFIQEEFQL